MRRSLGIGLTHALAVVTISTVPAGCASSGGRAVTGRELVEIDDTWAAAAAEGDLNAAMAYWTEDAVLYPEGHPPVYGRPAIREFMAAGRSAPGRGMAWTPCCAGVSDNGSMAYTLGEGTATVVEDTGATREVSGRYVSIWRKVRGAWRCAVKCWNASPRENRATP